MRIYFVLNSVWFRHALAAAVIFVLASIVRHQLAAAPYLGFLPLCFPDHRLSSVLLFYRHSTRCRACLLGMGWHVHWPQLRSWRRQIGERISCSKHSVFNARLLQMARRCSQGTVACRVNKCQKIWPEATGFGTLSGCRFRCAQLWNDMAQQFFITLISHMDVLYSVIWARSAVSVFLPSLRNPSNFGIWTTVHELPLLASLV